jgi:hypothetical protein
VIARFVILTLMACALTAAPAAAQGKGKGLGKRGGGGNASQAPAPVVLESDSGTPFTGSGLRQFGSWLDDASMLDEGSAWTALSFAHTRSAGATQTDFPVADLSYGMTPRAQVGVSFPYYRMRFADGTSIGGVGDVYLTAKLALVTPDAKRAWGVSITPIFEVLEAAAPGTSRFGLGMPVNAELRLGSVRVFGTSGFFTRGTLFASGALEVPVNERIIVTGALTSMRAINDDDLADALTLPKSRADLNVIGAYFLTPSVAVFGGAGRTLSNASTVGSSLLITAGVSLSMQ